MNRLIAGFEAMQREKKPGESEMHENQAIKKGEWDRRNAAGDNPKDVVINIHFEDPSKNFALPTWDGYEAKRLLDYGLRTDGDWEWRWEIPLSWQSGGVIKYWSLSSRSQLLRSEELIPHVATSARMTIIIWLPPKPYL